MRRREFLGWSSDGGPGLSEARARALVERIMGASAAEDTFVTLTADHRANTRYAVNRITTAGESVDLSASITARFGNRSATLSVNELDDRSLDEAVRAAADLARLAPEDRESMPLVEPQSYRTTAGWHESTATLDAAARAAVAAEAISQARAAGEDISVAGFLDARNTARAIGNSRGLFGFHPSTSASYSVTARTADGTGSGWAGVGHRDWSRVDAEALHATAVQKAIRSRDPRPLEPGEYPVILEPQAVADLMELLVEALDARAADEGRSAFAGPEGNLLGQQVVDERVTIRSDYVEMGEAPFEDDGMPSRPITWIEGGVLRNLRYSRFWASERGRGPTPSPDSYRMEGGEATIDDLIASADRAVLVTRLWYIRSLDPRTILYTGLTRDGTFWVENGRISHPVNNFRWNDSPLLLLRNLEELGRPVRVTGISGREIPPLRASRFTFSSVSEAV